MIGDWNFFVAIFSVCHCGLAIYMKKYLKEIFFNGNSNISPFKNIIFQKETIKRNQTPLRYHNSITNPN
jgi:hypothetical protein